MISDPAQYMAIALFVSFIVLIFTGYPVAWLMGGLAILFTGASVLSDTYLDTFFGVDWGYSSIMVARTYAVMNNWVLVALPMFVFMGIMMDLQQPSSRKSLKELFLRKGFKFQFSQVLVARVA